MFLGRIIIVGHFKIRRKEVAKKLFFKPRSGVNIEQIKESLEKKFPEFEYNYWGKIGKKGLKVKKSTFGGARVFFAMGRVWVKRTPPTVIGHFIDSLLFEMISSIKNNKITRSIVTYLKDEFGHMESLK